MTCLLCKGEMKPSATIHTVQLKNCVVVIKNVPCLKCEQCGEVVLSADTVEKIEHILQTVEKAVAEITVVNFPDCAAEEAAGAARARIKPPQGNLPISNKKSPQARADAFCGLCSCSDFVWVNRIV